MFDTLAAQIGAVFVVLVCAFAFLKGDPPERIAAGADVLLWFAPLLVQGDGSLYQVQGGALAGATGMLVVPLRLHLKSGAAWTVWALAISLADCIHQRLS